MSKKKIALAIMLLVLIFFPICIYKKFFLIFATLFFLPILVLEVMSVIWPLFITFFISMINTGEIVFLYPFRDDKLENDISRQRNITQINSGFNGLNFCWSFIDGFKKLKLLKEGRVKFFFATLAIFFFVPSFSGFALLVSSIINIILFSLYGTSFFKLMLVIFFIIFLIERFLISSVFNRLFVVTLIRSGYRSTSDINDLLATVGARTEGK